MILKTYPNNNLYGKYFLATEAPGDDEPDEPTVVDINANADRRRRKDFTDADDGVDRVDVIADADDEIDPEDFTDMDAGDTDDEPTPDETPAEDPAPVADDNAVDTAAEDDITPEDFTDVDAADDPIDEPATTDDTGDAGDPADDTTTDAPATNDAAATDPPATDDTGDAGDPNAGGSDDVDITADGSEPAADATDETDFTAVDDGGANPNAGADPNMDPNAVPQDNQNPDPNANKAGVDFDSTRKYNLYKELMSLYNSCENYISKLENMICNDVQQNQLVKLATNQLRDIKDLIHDYALIRFPINSYVQSLLFYQKIVVAIQVVFSMLKDIGNVGDLKAKNRNLKP